MAAHCYWANSWSATTVRDTKCLVQVQVADICSEFSGLCCSNKCIEVCAIHVDLSTSFVHHGADVADGFFEHTMSRRVRHHDCSKLRIGFCNLVFKVVDIDVSVVVTGNDHDTHSCHHCAGSVRAMRTGGNQANCSC